MTLPPTPADDAAIERLLRDFFAQEMPPELRPPRQVAAVLVTPRRKPRRFIVGSIAALTACGVIAVAASGRVGEPAERSEPANAWVAGSEGEARGPEGNAKTRNERDRTPSVRGHARSGLGRATRAGSADGVGSDDLDSGPLFVVESESSAGDRTVPTSVQPGGMAGGAPASVGLLDPDTGERVEFVVPEEVSPGPNPFVRGGAGSSGSPPDVRLPEERSR